MSRHIPVVYLAFANALDDHLANLKEESREIFKTLQSLQKDGKIWVHREESSQIDELYEDLLAYDQDIVIFHYGGHANGNMLQLEGGRGSAGGIAKLLGQQQSLKLVFLNGCATKNQVKQLHQAGVPAVIATSVKINDAKATIFSTAFYLSLAQGRGIEEAFDAASSLLETKYSANDVFDISFNRFPAWDEEEDTQDAEQDQALEWALYIRAEAHKDLSQWRLSSAQSDWQVQLRDVDGPIKSVLDDKPLVVDHKSVARTLSARLCPECGSTFLGDQLAENLCPLCQSDKLELGKAATTLPDLMLEHTISKGNAQGISQQVLEAHYTNGKASKALTVAKPFQLWLPYWKFDASIYNEYKGEVAFVAGLTGDVPELKWRSAQGRFDIPLTDHLVLASKAPWARAQVDDWDFSVAREYAPTDSAKASLLVDTNIEQAFGHAAQALHNYLDDEISDRLGGIEQKSVYSDTRYDHVNAKLLWLPYWLASATHEGEKISLLINGQSGAVNSPRILGKPDAQHEVSTFMNLNTQATKSDSSRAMLLTSAFSGIGIGIMAGFLMGLAAPQAEGEMSVVAIFISAVGVVLAAILGLNDRHFSVAKGLRIGSFGLAVTISALSGIYVRDHGLLTPQVKIDVTRQIIDTSDSAKNNSMINKPINKNQALAMNVGANKPRSLDAPQKTVMHMNDGRQTIDLNAPRTPAGSYLFSQEINLDTCSELQNPHEQNLSAADIIGNFKLVDGEAWQYFVDQVDFKIAEVDQKSTLFAGRDAVCGFKEFANHPVQIGDAQCELLLKAAEQDNFQLRELIKAFSDAGLTNISARVHASVSESQQAPSLNSLLRLFCGSSN
jgi:hypothetical protein